MKLAFKDTRWKTVKIDYLTINIWDTSNEKFHIKCQIFICLFKDWYNNFFKALFWHLEWKMTQHVNLNFM